MSTENKPIALNSTLQSLVTKMQLISDDLNDTFQSDWAESDKTAISYVRNKPENDFWTERSIDGNPLSFKTGSAQTAKSMKVTMSPVQDLHGYDNPWPAGGGKNLADFENGYSLDSNGDVIAFNGRIATVTPVQIDSNKSYRYVSSYNCVYAVFNGDTLVRRVSGVESGTILNTSDGDKLYLSSYGSTVVTVDSAHSMVLLSTEPTTPYSPYSNICPITGRSAVTIEGCGKNFCDDVKVEAINEDGSVTEVGNNIYRTFFADRLKAGTYTMSINGITSRIIRCAYEENGVTKIRVIAQNVNTYTIIFNNDVTNFRCSLRKTDSTAITENVQIQLELGNQATTYEPYSQSNQITISFGETVYGGTLNVETGECVVDKIILPEANKGWVYSPDGPIFRKPLTGYSTDMYPICNKYKSMPPAAGNSRAYNNGNCTTCFRSGTQDRIYIRDDAYNDADTFMAAIADIEIVYQLATPITLTLTPEQVSILKGHNNIWIEDDGVVMELTYVNDSENLTEVNDDFNVIEDCVSHNEENPNYSMHNYDALDYLLMNGNFYKVTVPIQIGDEIIVGANVRPTTIGAELVSAMQ